MSCDMRVCATSKGSDQAAYAQSDQSLCWSIVYLANSEDPDEMQHLAAFHQGLHCLLRLKQPSGTEIHHYLKTSTCDSLTCSLILIVSICMKKSIKIQRVK